MSLSVVRRFSTVGEAEAARSALDAADISAHIADENLVSVHWLYSEAVGGVKLRVRDEDREEAEQLLAEAAVEVAAEDVLVPAEKEEEEESAAVRCPACGGADVHAIPRLRIFALFAVLLAGIGVAVGQPELAVAGILAAGLIVAFVDPQRCRTCGARGSWQTFTEREPGAPPPDPADTAGLLCPRCGMPELHPIRYRRLKVIPFVATLLIFIVVPIWLVLPKKRCDHCGARRWW